MADIFISYAKEDRSRIEPLAEELKNQGWSVFWDVKIPIGKTWREVITEELDAAKCVIVMWSGTSIFSDWVIQEAEEAKDRHIYFPAMIDDVKLPLGFRGMEAAKLIDWEGESNHSGFMKLLSGIESITGPHSVYRTHSPNQKRQENAKFIPPENNTNNKTLKESKDPFFYYYLVACVLLTSTTLLGLSYESGVQQVRIIKIIFSILGISTFAALVWRIIDMLNFFYTPGNKPPVGYDHDPDYKPYLVLLSSCFIGILILILHYTSTEPNHVNREELLLSFTFLIIWVICSRIAWLFIDHKIKKHINQKIGISDAPNTDNHKDT